MASNNIVNNYCSMMVSIHQDVKKSFERNVEIIKNAEDELNDLYHEAEFANPKDMYKGYLIYKAIREARIRRRIAKEENELMKDMYDYLMSPAGQAFKTKIQSIQGASVKLRKVQESRTYQPRQRNDLTITGKTSAAHKPFEQMLADFNKDKASMRNGKLYR